MSPRFFANAKPSQWGDRDGQQTPVVRLYGGAGSRSVVVDYDAIPALVAQLEALREQHLEIENLTDRLFTE